MDNNKKQILNKTLAHLNQQMANRGRSLFRMCDATEDSDDILFSNKDSSMTTYLQAWAPQQDFNALMKRLKAAGKVLLLADFINPIMAEKLQQQSIDFIDSAGNMCLTSIGQAVFVKGNKDVRSLHPKRKGRMFNPAGLRLLYAFFNSTELLNASYRSIAKTVGVALGSIGPVMADLQHSGYLVEQDQQKHLINKKRLFERWVDAYLEKLRPKQLLGSYRPVKADWWKVIDISHYQAQWGGEIVIAKQTPFMLPDNVTVYCQDTNIEDFVTIAGLQADRDAGVSLYQAFWPHKLADETVNPMIVYADLLDSVDPANWEVAKTFYGDTIADFLQA